MAASVEVRLAQPGDDLTRAGEIVYDSYLSLPDYPVDPTYDDKLRHVADRAAHGEIVVALLDGELVGCLTFVPDPTSALADFDDPQTAGVRMFAVDASAQGHGVGRAMMQWCIDESRRRGLQRIGLHTIGIMTSAIRLYTSLGFEREPNLDADFDGVPGLAYILRL